MNRTAYGQISRGIYSRRQRFCLTCTFPFPFLFLFPSFSPPDLIFCRPSESAPNDLPDPASIRSTIQSLRHLRLAKIRTALRPPPPTNTSNNNNPDGGGGHEDPDTGAFSGRGEYMSLTGFTPFEVAQMRGMFGAVLGVVGRLSGGSAEVEGDGEAGMEVDR